MAFLSNLHHSILALVLCLLAGSVAGVYAPSLGDFAYVIGQIYLSVVSMAAIPLLAGARRLDLAGVAALDSAGLALFGELMQRNPVLELVAVPADFEALRQAYRLDARLQPLAH